MTEPLGVRLTRVEKAAKKHWEEYNLPPTVRWILEEAGISSTSETGRLVKMLEEDGRLEIGRTGTGVRKMLRERQR